jgi:hypothetical protein
LGDRYTVALPRVSAHIRSNLVGYLALFVALSGSAYAANQVGSKQIKRNAIKAKHIKDGKVGGAEIGDGAVTAADLAAGAVTSVDVRDRSLIGADLRNGAIRAPQVANEALTGGEIQDGSLTGDELTNNSVTGTDITNASLTGDDVNNGSLSGADLVTNPSFNGRARAGQVQVGSTHNFVSEIGIENKGGILDGYLDQSGNLGPGVAIDSPFVAANLFAALRPPLGAQESTTTTGFFLQQTLIADQQMLADELGSGGGFLYVRRPTAQGPLQLAVKWPDGEIDVLAQDD